MTSTRINLAIPIDLAIQIEKECEKRGVNRTQIIKEILYEKIQKDDNNDVGNSLQKIKEDTNEIKRILNTEISDSQCKCFTGRMSRLVNCLNGFDDLVNIKISDNEQIGNVITVIKEKLCSENKYDVDLHRELATKELTERGYDTKIIDEYVSYIE